jgi:hypothetical protein
MIDVELIFKKQTAKIASIFYFFEKTAFAQKRSGLNSTKAVQSASFYYVSIESIYSFSGGLAAIVKQCLATKQAFVYPFLT